MNDRLLSKIKRARKKYGEYLSACDKVAKTGYNRRDLEDWAATQLMNREYMIVSALRHHSGEPEEFQF